MIVIFNGKTLISPLINVTVANGLVMSVVALRVRHRYGPVLPTVASYAEPVIGGDILTPLIVSLSFLGSGQPKRIANRQGSSKHKYQFRRDSNGHASV